jgi:hypothetical protein
LTGRRRGPGMTSAPRNTGLRNPPTALGREWRPEDVWLEAKTQVESTRENLEPGVVFDTF